MSEHRSSDDPVTIRDDVDAMFYESKIARTLSPDRGQAYREARRLGRWMIRAAEMFRDPSTPKERLEILYKRIASASAAWRVRDEETRLRDAIVRALDETFVVTPRGISLSLDEIGRITFEELADIEPAVARIEPDRWSALVHAWAPDGWPGRRRSRSQYHHLIACLRDMGITSNATIPSLTSIVSNLRKSPGWPRVDTSKRSKRSP